jgi:hypothetical protein
LDIPAIEGVEIDIAHFKGTIRTTPRCRRHSLAQAQRTTDLLMQRAVDPQEGEAAIERCLPAKAPQPRDAGGEGY